MIALNKNKYQLVLPHLEQVDFNCLFAKTVIKGEVDGKIYVDNERSPSSFYVLHSYGMSLLFGTEKNKVFNSSLQNYLLNIEKKRKQTEWLQVFPDAWHTKLEELLGNQLLRKTNENEFIDESTDVQLIENTRINFKFNLFKYEKLRLKITPENYQIVTTTKELYNKMDGVVVPKAFWQNADQFIASGVGFSIIENGQLASTAYSAFIQDNQLELGIETLNSFQGKGLAAICCSALIDYCINNGFEPVWSCKLENTASYKLAEKLGFEVAASRPYYLVKQ